MRWIMSIRPEMRRGMIGWPLVLYPGRCPGLCSVSLSGWRLLRPAIFVSLVLLPACTILLPTPYSPLTTHYSLSLYRTFSSSYIRTFVLSFSQSLSLSFPQSLRPSLYPSTSPPEAQANAPEVPPHDAMSYVDTSWDAAGDGWLAACPQGVAPGYALSAFQAEDFFETCYLRLSRLVARLHYLTTYSLLTSHYSLLSFSLSHFLFVVHSYLRTIFLSVTQSLFLSVSSSFTLPFYISTQSSNQRHGGSAAWCDELCRYVLRCGGRGRRFFWPPA